MKLLPTRFKFFGKMASKNAGEVLLQLFVESGMSSEEDSDFGGEGVYCYQPGGAVVAETFTGDDRLDEEDADFSDEENSGQPVPTGSRDQADGE